MVLYGGGEGSGGDGAGGSSGGGGDGGAGGGVEDAARSAPGAMDLELSTML